MENTNFKKGDIVKSKLANRTMVVVGDVDEDNYVECMWHDANENIFKEFPVCSLEYAKTQL
ncbi:hypothetical protein CLV62_1205 [Dysgonomonas alginatilytica]|uniref:DUF2158 domain-containing protein n=1 Tax=Dysgonomonas alginatilytica TaxID=1605892 RepID=A0A2V3PNG0_9BACT|nr:hypothetical protein [Dysgonomonas alginatilytica]PXV62318.1 hypothetical protein CLV62_1205 [Dysgonomonas alginatilytica]